MSNFERISKYRTADQRVYDTAKKADEHVENLIGSAFLKSVTAALVAVGEPARLAIPIVEALMSDRRDILAVLQYEDAFDDGEEDLR